MPRQPAKGGRRLPGLLLLHPPLSVARFEAGVTTRRIEPQGAHDCFDTAGPQRVNLIRVDVTSCHDGVAGTPVAALLQTLSHICVVRGGAAVTAVVLMWLVPVRARAVCRLCECGVVWCVGTGKCCAASGARRRYLPVSQADLGVSNRSIHRFC